MRIATVTVTTSRLAGGLFNSVRGLSRGLIEAGVTNKVFSGSDHFTPLDADAWSGIDVSVSETYGSHGFCYTPDLYSSISDYGPDIIHQHNIWTYPSWTVLRQSRRGVPRIISPRGALDGWALSRSRLKKAIAMILYEKENILNANVLHALCDSELKSIRSFGYRGPVAVIPNGTEPPSQFFEAGSSVWRKAIDPGAKILLYLGRIHPKKNLINLIDGFAQSNRRANGKAAWHLCIAGWDQENYLDDLKCRVNELNASAFVHYIGPQFGAEKQTALRDADAFVLPSLSEGLPMAVLEAWAAGLPALITEECNLPIGFSSGAAMKIGHSADEIGSALSAFFDLDIGQIEAMSRAGRSLIERHFNWNGIGVEMRNVYNWMLGGGSPPSSVDL